MERRNTATPRISKKNDRVLVGQRPVTSGPSNVTCHVTSRNVTPTPVTLVFVEDVLEVTPAVFQLAGVTIPN